MLNTVMPHVVLIVCYAECHYATWRYAECHYAECRGAWVTPALPTKFRLGFENTYSDEWASLLNDGINETARFFKLS